MTEPDFQPLLEDDVVRLRPLRYEDRAALFEIASDPLIWAQHPASDRWREDVFGRFFDDALASRGAMLIQDAATGQAIGSSRFDVSRAGAGEAEIGWTFLARSRWGGDTNRAVKRLMIGHVLRTFERAIFLIGAENIRSRRAIEKIGGVLTERTVSSEIEGRTVAHVVYAIDRTGFAAGPLAG